MEQSYITEDEIQYLFEFTRYQTDGYRDVQLEMVDHLASAIEDYRKEQPNISFYHALDRALKSLGEKGIAAIVEAKRRAISRSAYRMVGEQLLQFFKWPQIALLLILNWVLYQLMQALINPFILGYAFMAVVFLSFFFLFVIYLKRWFYSGRKYLITEEMFTPVLMLVSLSWGLLVVLPEAVVGFSWSIYFLSFHYAVFTLLMYLILYRLPRRIEQLYQEKESVYA